MIVNVKNLVTGEVLHENLDIADVVFGADENDDNLIVLTADGTALVFTPRDDFLVYDPTTPPDQPPFDPDIDARLSNLENIVGTLIGGILNA